MTGWTVRASTEDDWQAYRTLRFEMLEDAPIAFLETLEQARAHPDEHWRRRAANTSSTSRLFAAVADDGRWLGSMGGFQSAPSREPYLVGVYVSPAWRGREHGMTDALLDAVIDWARAVMAEVAAVLPASSRWDALSVNLDSSGVERNKSAPR